MAVDFQLHIIALEQILTLAADLTRKTYIEQRKQQIYAYRNQCLGQFIGQDILATAIATTAWGKPYLVDRNCYFNHSHSQKHYALLMSASMQDIGVDIEDLDRKVRFDALAQHAFHPDEYQKWQRLQQDKIYWFQVWTRKEAILKAAGLGIRLNLKELNTENMTGQCQHPLIGNFAYKSQNTQDYMLSMAWRIA